MKETKTKQARGVATITPKPKPPKPKPPTKDEALKLAQGHVTWRQTRKRGTKIEGSWINDARIEHENEWDIRSRYANDYAGSGAEVREHRNYSGSPPPAFGFTHADEASGLRTKGWPVVSAHVPLPVGAEDLQTKLSALLRETIEDFLRREGLLVPESRGEP